MAENRGSGDEEKGTKRSIYAALAANFLITVSKFVAGFATGSAALLERITTAMRDEMPEVAQTFIELHPPGRKGQSGPRERVSGPGWP